MNHSLSKFVVFYDHQKFQKVCSLKQIEAFDWMTQKFSRASALQLFVKSAKTSNHELVGLFFVQSDHVSHANPPLRSSIKLDYDIPVLEPKPN